VRNPFVLALVAMLFNQKFLHLSFLWSGREARFRGIHIKCRSCHAFRPQNAKFYGFALVYCSPKICILGWL